MDIHMNQLYDTTLPKALNDFLIYLDSIKGKSPNTLSGYKFDLTIFFKFLKIYSGLSLEDALFENIIISDITIDLVKTVTLEDLYSFISFTEKFRNNGSYARARKVATLKSFFKYLNSKARIINENPAQDLESPKINKRNPIYLSLSQSKVLLHSIQGKTKERDYCIITLFLNCGLRLSELCSIDLSKIRDDTLTVIGKGNKERTIYLNSISLKSISQYLEVRSKNEKILLPNKDALFISGQNKRINKRTVEVIVKKYLQLSGITDNKYSPHKLRHTAATLMYKYGNVDIRSLQSILGHENISTTQIYTHVDEEQLRAAVKANPLNEE